MSSMNLNDLCEGLKPGGIYSSQIANLNSLCNVYVAQHGQNSMAGQLEQNIGGLRQGLIDLANVQPVARKIVFNTLQDSIRDFVGNYPAVSNNGNVNPADYQNAILALGFLRNVMDI